MDNMNIGGIQHLEIMLCCGTIFRKTFDVNNVPGFLGEVKSIDPESSGQVANRISSKKLLFNTAVCSDDNCSVDKREG